jgi:hypothetical protein
MKTKFKPTTKGKRGRAATTHPTKAKAKAPALSQSEIVRTKGDLFVHPDAATYTGKVDKTVPAKIAALPFVRSSKRDEKGRRCFWLVEATGEYGKDYAQGRAYARLVLPLLKYNVGGSLLSSIVDDMIKAGERNGLVLGFVREIADQLKNARANLFIAAVATNPKVPSIQRKGTAVIRKLWRESRSDIMAAMTDAL